MGSTSESASKLAESTTKVQQSSAGLDRVSGAARRVERSLGSVARGAKQFRETVKEAGNRGASGLEKVVASLKRIAVSMVLRRLLNGLLRSVGESFQQMATENEHVNQTLSKIVSSLKYVSDALASAIYPIIAALEPVITTILDGLAQILNFIGRIVAFFTGQDYVVQAKKHR